MSASRVSSADEWEHLLAGDVYRLDVAAAGPAFSASMRKLELPYGVRVSQIETGPTCLRRSSRLVRTAPSDDLLLLVKLAGRGRTESADRTAEIGPGDAVLFDPSRPYVLFNDERSDELVVTFPRSLLAVPAERQREALLSPLPPSMPSLGALAGLVRGIMAFEAGVGGVDELGQVSATLLDLVAAVVRTSASAPPSMPGGRRAQLAQLQEYAMHRLGDPDLTVTRIARAHGVSVRHVGELFHAAEDSPAAFIRRQRLHRTRAELANPRHAHRSIAEVARSWGFFDDTTFTRAFRRAYDMTPSQWRAQPLTASSAD